MIDPKIATTCLNSFSEMAPVIKNLIEEMGLMPNAKMKATGGNVWWNNLLDVDAWRIQHNSVTGHCRILNPENVRHAWGTEDKINEFFEKISRIDKILIRSFHCEYKVPVVGSYP